MTLHEWAATARRGWEKGLVFPRETGGAWRYYASHPELKAPDGLPAVFVADTPDEVDAHIDATEDEATAYERMLRECRP